MMFTTFVEETGYDREKYGAAGYDIKYKDEDTKILIGYIEELLLKGTHPTVIQKMMSKEMNIGYAYSKPLLGYVEKLMSKKLEDDVSKTLNGKRLLQVYKDAMAANDYKNAIAALKEINKIMGYDVQKVELTTNTYQLNFDYGDEK